MDTQGFYKKDGDQWFYAPNFVYSHDYSLEKIGNRESIDGWAWYDVAPEEFLKWESEMSQDDMDMFFINASKLI